MRNRLPSTLLPFFLVFVLIAGCQGGNQLTGEVNDTPFFQDDEPLRPEFNRTPQPPEPEKSDPTPPPRSDGVFLNKNVGVTQLRVPLNYPLGWTIPVLTMEELPILRPAPIKTGDNLIRSYRQWVRLEFNETGNVSLIADKSRDPDYLGTALYFPEDQPYFSYGVALQDRPFFLPTMLGSDITLLGETFRIMEATNFTLLLNGVDVPQYLRINDDERFETNNKKILGSRVDYDGFGFTYNLTAPDVDDDGLWLREGETLKQRLAERGQDEAIIGRQFDIRYDGLEELPVQLLTFKNRDDFVELQWEGPAGTVRVPLLGRNDEDLLWHGNSENKLHLQECPDRNTGCVHEEDLVMLYGRPSANADFVSGLYELSGLDPDEGKIIFRDAVTRERVSTDWEGNISDSRYPARAYLPFHDHEYVIYVDGYIDNETNETVPTGIAIDLDGDGAIRGDHVPLLIEGVELTFENLLEEPVGTHTLNITLEVGPSGTQRRYTDGRINKEILHVQVHGGNEFSITIPHSDDLWNQELIPDFDDEFAQGLSDWGTLIVLEMDDSEETQSTTEEVAIALPFEQRHALISIGTLRD